MAIVPHALKNAGRNLKNVCICQWWGSNSESRGTFWSSSLWGMDPQLWINKVEFCQDPNTSCYVNWENFGILFTSA